MLTYKLQNIDGQYFTEPILSTEEWLQVLRAADNGQHRRQLDVLRMFLYQPGHKGTCAKISKEYSMSDSGINMLVQHFGKFAQKNCGKEFRIESSDSTDDTYWPITMLGRNIKGGFFEWELRPELVKALQRFLIDKLIEAYRGPVISEGLDSSRSGELYKWQFISAAQGKTTGDLVRSIVSKECNFVEKAHFGATIITLLETAPESVFQAFELLLQDKPLNERLRDFSAAAKAITPSGKSSFGDERTAAAFLGCIDPQHYTPYTSTIYEAYCKYLGIPIKPAGQKYPHFLELLQDLIPIEQEDAVLQEALHRETDPLFWSDLLNAQDILWQMQEYAESKLPKNWLQVFYDDAIRANERAFSWWYPQYKDSVELFLGMFSEGKTAEDIPEKTIDYYIRAQQNWVCNNGQGCFTHEEYPKIKEMWTDIYDVLKRNVAAGDIDRDDYRQLEQHIRPVLNTNHPVAYHRLWSALFPEKLTTCCKDSDFARAYDTTRFYDNSLPARTGNWLEDNLVFMDYLGQKVTYKEPWHRAILARYIFDNLKKEANNTDMDKYIDLLTANHNLVLTGAPGTGKTYLAKKIAEAMGDEDPGFVQFHPSYDYTDFVEGLRPNDDGTFERVNGVFKQFCAEALSGVKASDFDKAYDALLADLAEMEEPLKLTTPNGGATFAISVNNRGSLNLHTGTSFVKQGSLTRENIRSQIGGDKVYNYWKGYFEGVVKLLKDKYGLSDAGPTLKPTNHIFIIDEINRGELSKIFGELFFAIDPGYRGVKGKVKTQYQNMVDPGDPFDKGFYVPENVYIIGTMNDIDRGVESMDFAIRRRFAWVEVKVEDRVSMLDEQIPDWADAAKRCMTALNEALKEKGIGLTSAYDIGPAYFLKLEQYDGDFEKLWEYHIKGIVTEYLRGTRGIEEKVATLKEAFDAYKE